MTNLSTSDVKFPAGPKDGMGFLAHPGEGGPFPALVVIQEWWGLDEQIKDVTRRFANEGFVGLAVDMYDGKTTRDPAEAQKLMMSLDEGTVLDKLNGAVQALKANPLVSKDRIGVVGFCLGGRLSLLLACRN